jgi:hypothetical protein
MFYRFNKRRWYMAGPGELGMWNVKSSSSYTKNEEVEGKTSLEILKIRESPDRTLSPIRELHKLREYSQKTSEPATLKSELLKNLMSHSLNKHVPMKEMPLHSDVEALKGVACTLLSNKQLKENDKEELSHEGKNYRDLSKDAAAMVEQLNLRVVGQDTLSEDRKYLIHEAKCTAEVIRATKQDRDSVKHDDRRIPGQCKDIAALEDQICTMTMESNELKKDREALLYEVLCTSEEKEAIMKERDTLKLEVEELRGLCKDIVALEDRICMITMESNELKKDREALLYEVVCISEEKEFIRKDRDGLRLENENLRTEFGRKS